MYVWQSDSVQEFADKLMTFDGRIPTLRKFPIGDKEIYTSKY